MARTELDPYHSRAEARWTFGPRLDPVIWGDRNGLLSPHELASYEERGFLIKPAMFEQGEVLALAAEAERMANAADHARDDVITEPAAHAVRSLFRVHRESETVARLAAGQRLAGVARQILGSDVYLHQSRINFKPAFEGKAFPWHSDFETWHIEDGMPRMRALSASVLLTDNTEHNGPLLVIPGSHRVYVRCVGETPQDHFRQSLRRQEYGVPDREALSKLVHDGGIAAVTGPAGSVVFFDCNLMHGSGGNITPMPRHNVFLVYNSTENVLVEPFGGRSPRPLFLAEREPVQLSE
jgi:ectoine hydroxylase